MKLSNKILLGLFCLIALSNISFMLVVRSEIGNIEGITEDRTWSSNTQELAPFDALFLEDGYNITIETGEKYELEVETYRSEGVLPVTTHTEDGLLTLSVDLASLQYKKNYRIHIRTPKVKTIILNNKGIATLEKFNQDSLTVKLSDDAHLVTNYFSLDQLTLEANESSRLIVRDCDIKNIHLTLFDDAEFHVNNLTNTSLIGSLNDHSRLIFSGSASQMNLVVDRKAEIIKSKD